MNPASTVVVLRAAAGVPFEVLMVRRNDTVAFMAGAYVFPGGRVDATDWEAGTESAVGTGVASRFVDLGPTEERAFRHAAVRELEEEAAVRVAPDDLIPLAHWVTPEVEIRRYDTRFFLVVMPDGQEARHDQQETTALAWLSPEQAIVEYRADRILLPPPTWTTLRQLARHPSLEAAVAWARTRPIVRVQPGFQKDDFQTLLTLPGDALYPTLPGWEVPEETRFKLEAGRWRPVE
jgi:8-oxo-dGTP pyrophosphatase MutT (NUDIX family)